MPTRSKGVSAVPGKSFSAGGGAPRSPRRGRRAGGSGHGEAGAPKRCIERPTALHLWRHETVSTTRYGYAMLASCNRCGHDLWSEVRCLGSFRFLIHFDDDEGSGTYAEHVSVCPGCGGGLNGDAADPWAVSPEE